MRSKKTELNLDYLNANRVLIPETSQILLALVGCGGTGSWLAPAVVRVAKLLLETGKQVSVNFLDPDSVEEKNIYRQNFCAAEIGRNKAVALAQRYGLAWGVEVHSHPVAFDRDTNISSELVVLLGCVDNGKARQEIHASVLKNSQYGYGGPIWWIDCGNSKNSGQVLIGCNGKGNKKQKIKGVTTAIPLPTVLHPDLLREEEERESEKFSCAEMALRDSQGLAINQRMAAETADYLIRLLITKDLRKFESWIDLESGSCQSKYITEENLNVNH